MIVGYPAIVASVLVSCWHGGCSSSCHAVYLLYLEKTGRTAVAEALKNVANLNEMLMAVLVRCQL